MSQKERKRLVVLEQIKKGPMSLLQASQVMKVCYRQARRIWRRYQESGDRGLVQEPQTQFGRAMKQLAVELILANSPQAKGRVERRNAVCSRIAW